MMKLKIAVLGLGSLLIVGCLLSGCAVHYHDYDDRPQQVVHVNRSHVCGPDCHEHYWNGSRVVVIRGHRHGPGCGHDWDGRYWVLVSKTPVHKEPVYIHKAPAKHVDPPGKVIHGGPYRVSKVKHVHNAHCGCVYHPQRKVWIIVESEGHVHGPGCGHFYLEGRWSIGG